MIGKKLRLHIRYLGESKHLPADEGRGLCSELLGITDFKILLDLMNAWPGSSKNHIYPVPHPTMHPATAYYRIWNKWNPNRTGISNNTREYILNRLRMCRWVARQLYKLPEWR